MPRSRPRSVGAEIETICASLRSIGTALQRLAPLAEAASVDGRHERQGPAPAEKTKRQAPKLRLSAARRAALKLQGQYIGHIRNLPPRQKARVRALRETKGVRAAISFAKKLAKP